MDNSASETRVTARFSTRDPSLHIAEGDRTLLIQTSECDNRLEAVARTAEANNLL